MKTEMTVDMKADGKVAQEYIWPNFFIVGGVKCGTTTLYAYLKHHPQVFLPETKEPHFFADIIPPKQEKHSLCAGDLQKYQGLYRKASNFAAIGDASPSYLWDPTSPQRIREVAPHARIIVLLRDPIARAHSHYLMNVLHGEERMPFLEALKADHAQQNQRFWKDRLYVGLGMYYEQVKRYFEIFGREQVLVLLFDDLLRNPKELLAATTTHIGVDELPDNGSDSIRAHNPYRAPRFQSLQRVVNHYRIRNALRKYLPESVQDWLKSSRLLNHANKPSIDAESKRFLQDIYAPDVARLEDLLGRKLPELRKSWLK